MIIIPDAEMPKSCADCPLEYDSICCRAFDIEFYPEEDYSYNDYCSQRHPDCKLRELVRCKDCKRRNTIDCGMQFYENDDDGNCSCLKTGPRTMDSAIGGGRIKTMHEWIVSEEELGVDGAYYSGKELVRCKDCKNRPMKRNPIGNDYGFNLYSPIDDEICPCIVGDNWYSWMPQDNFYCAYGERKENV